MIVFFHQTFLAIGQSLFDYIWSFLLPFSTQFTQMHVERCQMNGISIFILLRKSWRFILTVLLTSNSLHHSLSLSYMIQCLTAPFGLPLITCARYHVRTNNSFGDKSFGAVDPRICNSLARGLRTLYIRYKHFKALLKTYIFRQDHGAL